MYNPLPIRSSVQIEKSGVLYDEVEEERKDFNVNLIPFIHLVNNRLQ